MDSSAYEKALALIDDAHSEDPSQVTVDGTTRPYELLYAQKSTAYLEKRESSASQELKLAVRAQHLRRWEVPRDSYPMSKIGYHAWRNALKRRQAAQAKQCCLDAGVSPESSNRVAALIGKDGLSKGDVETQILEDVACLVFLDDQFEQFKDAYDPDKIIIILRKTWAKMSDEGHKLALEIPMSDDAKSLVHKALNP